MHSTQCIGMYVRTYVCIYITYIVKIITAIRYTVFSDDTSFIIIHIKQSMLHVYIYIYIYIYKSKISE